MGNEQGAAIHAFNKFAIQANVLPNRPGRDSDIIGRPDDDKEGSTGSAG